MYKYLFGPVPSRRLGMSLGIDLVPKKVCSLNCVYCEVGETTKLTIDRKEYVLYNKVISEIDEFMATEPIIDFITFSGSGEPTLNIRIGELMHYIHHKYPKTKMAVLTNGTLLSNNAVRSEILLADVILPSLDAASQEVFEYIDRPKKELRISNYIQGLVNLRQEFKGEIWLEVFLLKAYNDSRNELDLLKQAILRIKPDRVQLNTLDRPGTVHNLVPLSHTELQAVVDLWRLNNVEIIAAPIQRNKVPSYHLNIEHSILNTISRRPCTLSDLHQFLGIHINEINKYLGVLEELGKIKMETKARGSFYSLND